MGLGIKKEERKRAFLLRLLGPETQDIFETLANTETKYEEAANTLNA